MREGSERWRAVLVIFLEGREEGPGLRIISLNNTYKSLRGMLPTFSVLEPEKNCVLLKMFCDALMEDKFKSWLETQIFVEFVKPAQIFLVGDDPQLF